ncbi:hypothetical protein H4R34_004218 [Dimargaris verticillata]|uniref:ATP-dependent RNA helicase n=1 Tax=Dimargaris verticillata TaxID=2761393 RepID=A0A9W8AZA2_9FUNG|nr:hypothetical protein H4R34_004218 [Dimargaris verticillata]
MTTAQPDPNDSANTTWRALLSDPALLVGVDALGLKVPTTIQRKAIPAIRNQGDVAFVAQTGSGKTLAYLLPLLERLRNQPPTRPSGSPYALIIVPNQPLVWQISAVVHRLARLTGIPLQPATDLHQVPIKPTATAAPFVLIVTPEGLPAGSPRQVRQLGQRLETTQYVVVDELDICLGGSFEAKSTMQLLWILTRSVPGHATAPRTWKYVVAENAWSPNAPPLCSLACPTRCQFVFCGATLSPKTSKTSVRAYLRQGFPTAQLLVNNDAFCIAPQTTEVLVQQPPARPGWDKAAYIAQVVDAVVQRLNNHGVYWPQQSTVIVFAKNSANATAYYRTFTATVRASPPAAEGAVGIATTLYVKSLDADEKADILHRMSTVSPTSGSLKRDQRPLVTVVFTANSLHRGMDLPCVRSIVLADFVQNIGQYIHCAGRTARAGQAGEVVSVVPNMDHRIVQALVQCNSPYTIDSLDEYVRLPGQPCTTPKRSLEPFLGASSTKPAQQVPSNALLNHASATPTADPKRTESI